MKRSLRFWTRYTWESMAVLLGAMAALAVLSLLGADREQMADFAAQLPYLLCASAIFGLMMINTGSQTLYIPLLLSMGETRRNVLLGFHYYRTLIISVTLALCALIWLLIPGEVSSAGLRSIPTILCVLVASSSMGSILGTLFTKWKWLATVIIIILCGGAGGAVGFMGVAASDSRVITETLEMAAHLEALPWWLALTAVAALALDVAFQWMLLRRQEVKL